MKKIFGILIYCLCCLIFVDLAVAQSNYDYRLDNIENSKEYKDIIEFQDDILSDIYGNAVGSGENSVSEIDFTRAVKTYNYTLEALLNNISNGTLLQNIRNNDNYSWKVPVGLREDGGDHAVIYKLPDDKFSYYTVSASKTGMKQVYYIFNPRQTSDLIDEENKEFNNIYALSISNMSMDLIVIDSKDAISFIPFASRDDLLEIENGKIYTSNEMSDVVNKYIKASSTGTIFSGGSASETSKNNKIIYVMISLLFAAIILYTLINFKKRRVNK